MAATTSLLTPIRPSATEIKTLPDWNTPPVRPPGDKIDEVYTTKPANSISLALTNSKTDVPPTGIRKLLEGYYHVPLPLNGIYRNNKWFGLDAGPITSLSNPIPGTEPDWMDGELRMDLRDLSQYGDIRLKGLSSNQWTGGSISTPVLIFVDSSRSLTRMCASTLGGASSDWIVRNAYITQAGKLHYNVRRATLDSELTKSMNIVDNETTKYEGTIEMWSKIRDFINDQVKNRNGIAYPVIVTYGAYSTWWPQLIGVLATRGMTLGLPRDVQFCDLVQINTDMYATPGVVGLGTFDQLYVTVTGRSPDQTPGMTTSVQAMKEFALGLLIGQDTATKVVGSTQVGGGGGLSVNLKGKITRTLFPAILDSEGGVDFVADMFVKRFMNKISESAIACGASFEGKVGILPVKTVPPTITDNWLTKHVKDIWPIWPNKWNEIPGMNNTEETIKAFKSNHPGPEAMIGLYVVSSSMAYSPATSPLNADEREEVFRILRALNGLLDSD